MHLAGDGDRVGLGQEGNGDASRRPAVEIERFTVGLGAELDVPDVADPRDPFAGAGLDLDDDVLVVRRVVQAAVEVQRILEVLPLHRGRRADLARRNLLALLLDNSDVARTSSPKRRSSKSSSSGKVFCEKMG